MTITAPMRIDHGAVAELFAQALNAAGDSSIMRFHLGEPQSQPMGAKMARVVSLDVDERFRHGGPRETLRADLTVTLSLAVGDGSTRSDAFTLERMLTDLKRGLAPATLTRGPLRLHLLRASHALSPDPAFGPRARTARLTITGFVEVQAVIDAFTVSLTDTTRAGWRATRRGDTLTIDADASLSDPVAEPEFTQTHDLSALTMQGLRDAINGHASMTATALSAQTDGAASAQRSWVDEAELGGADAMDFAYAP